MNCTYTGPTLLSNRLLIIKNDWRNVRSPTIGRSGPKLTETVFRRRGCSENRSASADDIKGYTVPKTMHMPAELPIAPVRPFVENSAYIHAPSAYAYIFPTNHTGRFGTKTIYPLTSRDALRNLLFCQSLLMCAQAARPNYTLLALLKRMPASS